MTTAALGSAMSPARLAARQRSARRGGLARLAVFVPLSLFGLVVWSGLVDPAATSAAVAMTVVGAAGGGVLLFAGTIAPRRRRNALLAVTALAVVAAAFLSAGVPARMLLPDRWDELVSGISAGIQAMPGITVPYRGTDQWVRLTLMLGATALVAIATFQAFWPRERGEVPGSALGAAFSLGTLYAVPVIEHGPDRPYVSGAVFAALLAAFLFADRVQLTQIPGAAVLVALATLTGFVVAPALDSNGPWIDYRHIADDVSDAGTVGYRWNHDYGPLDWPRKGRVLLKVKAQSPAYWKAEVLDTFDGRIWRHSDDDDASAAFESDGDRDVTQPQWFQDIHVEVRGLRSAQFISAGVTRSIDHATRQPVAALGGTFETARGLLRPGATYDASVYTPRPTASRMERAPYGRIDYRSDVERWLRVEVPDLDGHELPSPGFRDRPVVSFPVFGATDQATIAEFPRGGIPDGNGAAVMRRSSLRRIYDLAQSLKRGTQTPYEFVKAVEARVKNGATYTETPGRHAHPLDAFLFGDRRGYCQHFSGAMALLLRMGGVPARIATGFTPGQADQKGTTFTVRDFDAHSWVEVYFPSIGWVTFDPTPSAAPAREQTTDEQAALNVSRGASAGDGDRLSDPNSGAASSGSGTPWTELLLLAAVLLAAAIAIGVMVVRRRRSALPVSDDDDIAVLERALRRSGRPLAPGVTLAALERQLAGSDGARDYLRALSSRRFGAGGPPPGRAARQAMRHELAAGLGRWGRLRAWWALPPSVARRGGGRRPAGRYPG